MGIGNTKEAPDPISQRHRYAISEYLHAISNPGITNPLLYYVVSAPATRATTTSICSGGIFATTTSGSMAETFLSTIESTRLVGSGEKKPPTWRDLARCQICGKFDGTMVVVMERDGIARAQATGKRGIEGWAG